MPSEIDREEVQRLVAGGAQLVEVLPASEYREDHLPGAINIPLAQIDARAKEILDLGRSVIVYCADSA